MKVQSIADVKNIARLKSMKLEGWISVIANILLFGVKYWAGIVSGSIAIIADAWHTLSDSVSSLAVLIGARFSSKPPDKDHPFGHGRVEMVVSLFIAVFLFIIAYGFVAEAWDRYSERQITVYGPIAIIVTAISVISKEILARYAFSLGNKTGSEVLKADGWHHRSDAVSSLVILVGIFAGRYLWWIDSLLAVIVAILIAHAAWQIVSKSISAILGEPVDQELIDSIREIGGSVSSLVTDFHHFHNHNYISHSEITFHIRLPGGMTIEEGHRITDSIEKKVKEVIGVESTIHLEPIKKSADESK
ncbi:MAG: cation transporter [Bacteroidales bacterium]|nr:cation transporter [Bacteroidales bacterium]